MDKDANVDYTMKDQVIFNSPRSHCEELNDEAIQKSRDCFANARNDNMGVSLRGSETTEAISYAKNALAMAGENLWKVTGNYQINTFHLLIKN